MKIRQTMMMAALLSTPAIAQEDMPTVWTTDLDHKCQYTGIGDFGAKDYKANGISYGASDKEITVFENETGKILWSKPYKEIAPNLRKIDDLYPFWQSASIFLFDRKLGKDQVACIDLKTGALLWSSDKYQNLTDDNVIYIPEREAFCVTTKEALHFIKARTGEEVWSTDKFHGVVGKYVFTPDGNVVMVNFMPSLISAMFSGFKNEIAKVNLDNGDIIWTTDYIGRAERKVVTKQFLYNLKVEDDKVILELGGLQVYDYKTGAKLWSAAFDFTPDGVASAPAHA